MVKNPFEIKIPNYLTGLAQKKEKVRRRTITMAEKKWLWKQKKKHICPICNKQVKDFFDAEFDHKRAYAKNGKTTPANTLITHKLCNRLKGKKSLSTIKKHLGTHKPKKRKVTKKKKRVLRKPNDSFGFGNVDFGFG